jgi:hypothetical protein
MKAYICKGWFIVALAALAIVSTPAISRAGVKNFMTVINGAQETPPNGSTALGNGILTYDTGTKTLCYYFSYIGALAGGEILAHIHGPAAPGVPAGIILTLPLGNPKQACVVAPAAPFNHKDLLKNLYYINIHSLGFPGGEIRGQIYRIK